MKKTGKALIGVLSVAALVGTGVATWTINGGIVRETTGPITPTIAEIGTRDIAIDVTAKDSSLVFDNPDDLMVIYNVKAKAGTGAAKGFEPYGYDFKNIVPEYQPNLSITTQVLRNGTPIDEGDPFFDFVEVPSDESETKISYSDWLNADLKDKGYDATLTFAWGAETGGLNPQEYVDLNSSTYNTPELQRGFFERVNAALDKITFTFTFKVGGLKDTPVETPDTGEINIPTVTGSTLRIDGMTGTTVEAGTHRITITTEEGKEVTDKKLTVIENGTTRTDVTLTEETLTRASGHTYYVDYEFKADTTYSFEYTLKDEEVPPTLYIVTYTQPENGKITLMNDETEVTTETKVDENTTLDLIVTANEGYHITSVLVNGEEAGIDYTTKFTKQITVTGDLTISATMEIDAPVVEKFVVTYEAIENGTIELKNGNETVTSGTEIEKGTELSLTVTANDGYEITSILVNAEELNAEKTYESPYTTSLTINEATTIKATVESVGEDLSKPIKATIADVIADQTFDQTHLYEVTGTITELGTRIDYGRFTLSDGEGNELEIYGSRIENNENPSLYYENGKWDYNFNKGDDPTPAIAVSNEITMHVFGKKNGDYNNYYGVIIDYHTPEIAPESIEITNGESAEVTEGNSIQLNVSTNPELITVPLTWTTENEEIANVDQNGLVTGVSEGSTNITVSYGEVKDTILITVNKKAEQEIITLGLINLKQDKAGNAIGATTEEFYNLMSTSLTSEYIIIDESGTSIVDCTTDEKENQEFYLAKGSGGPSNVFGPRFGKNHDHTVVLKMQGITGNIKVTEVVISFASWSATEGQLKVNESAFQKASNTVAEEITYSINATDTLNITSNARTVLQTITIKGYIEQ